MPNRYARDELIMIALDMAQLPNLTVHDAPNGVVQPDAFCIQWLQDILDFWFHMCPFSATVTRTDVNIPANSESFTVPTDFILDVRNGLLMQTVVGDTHSLKRTYRVPLQKFINRKIISQRQNNVLYPVFYCIVGDDKADIGAPTATPRQLMFVAPVPTVDVVGVLWYYALPAVLLAEQRPKMPNDYVCTEYIRIRAREWAGIEPPGTAQMFCQKVIAGMKAAGLMNEPEDDEIPFDVVNYSKADYASAYFTTYAWMGNV